MFTTDAALTENAVCALRSSLLITEIHLFRLSSERFRTFSPLLVLIEGILAILIPLSQQLRVPPPKIAH